MDRLKRLKSNIYLHIASGEIIKTNKMNYGNTIKLACGKIAIKTPFGLEILK